MPLVLRAVMVIVFTLLGGSRFMALAADPPAALFTIEIKGRKVVGALTTLRVKYGDMVTLRWRTDEPVRLHLHGYDIEALAKPDSPAAFTFKAYATGRFPITAHGFGAPTHAGAHEETPLVYLEVHPR